jgi:hypothetical protein
MSGNSPKRSHNDGLRKLCGCAHLIDVARQHTLTDPRSAARLTSRRGSTKRVGWRRLGLNTSRSPVLVERIEQVEKFEPC